MSKLTKEKIVSLQAAGLPHMTADNLGVQIKQEATPEQRVEAERRICELNEYLKAFTPMEDGKCICCGQRQGVSDQAEGIIAMITGSGARFRWGLAHGEGNCSECGYPGRAIHYVGDWLTSHEIMQYHPDGLSIGQREREAVQP